MLWTIYCIDKCDVGHIRDELMAAHRAHMARFEGSLFFSGPLVADDDDSHLIGSLFILNAGKAEVDRFLADEPFGQAGIFESIAVRRLRAGRFNPKLSDVTPPG